MSEKRTKLARISVKVAGVKGTLLIELFDATQWDDGHEGQVRLRVGGHMMAQYQTLQEVGDFLTRYIAGEDPRMKPDTPPVVKRGTRISLPCEPFDKGEYIGIEGGFIESDDVVRGHDGRWYCIASGTTRRLGLVPIDEITLSARVR